MRTSFILFKIIGKGENLFGNFDRNFTKFLFYALIKNFGKKYYLCEILFFDQVEIIDQY